VYINKRVLHTLTDEKLLMRFSRKLKKSSHAIFKSFVNEKMRFFLFKVYIAEEAYGKEILHSILNYV
jgi:hypothetical protein